jgi:imidazolonepropionase-like amidohydrolase
MIRLRYALVSLVVLVGPAAGQGQAPGPSWRPGIPVAVDLQKVPPGTFAEYTFSLAGQKPWKQKFALVGRDEKAHRIEAVLEGGPLGPGSQAIVRLDLEADPRASHPVRRMVLRAGDLAAMEFPAGPALARDQFARLDPAKAVDERDVTVPAGTFKTKYFKESAPDGATVEYWVNEGVGPFGIVKIEARNRPGGPPLSMQLLARGTGARATLVEQARPHDPQLFNRELMVTAQGGPLDLPDEGETTVFQNVNLIPMTGEKVLGNQTVVVRGDRIISADGRKVKVANARSIDGAGKYLMPGLAEMHGHIPPSSNAAWAGEVLLLYAANGITTVRGMLGYPGQLELREAVKRGDIIGPSLYLAGTSFNGQSINSAAEAVEKVKQQKKEGWDLLKVHPGLTREEYDAMARTARAQKIRFGGHVPSDVGLLHAIEMGQETFDHVDGYVELLEGDKAPVDDKKLDDVVKRSKRAGVWIVPTMALWEVLQSTLDLKELTAYPELKYVPQTDVEQWTRSYKARLEQQPRERASNVVANRLRILRALNEGGTRILMGTDAPQQFSVPGFSLHRELAWMRKAGMTPYQILVSGTRNVGEYFKGSDSFGTIAPGKRADLVLLDANPLTDVGNLSRISGVMLRGRWLPRAEIDARLAKIASKYRR